MAGMNIAIPELLPWQGFYSILGSAAGALIGLQFVVLTLIAERPAQDAELATAAFGSPTVVHFASVLFLSALLNVPFQSILCVALLCGLLGLVGIAYSGIVVRRLRRQAAYEPILEDWVFHVALPFLAYIALSLTPLAVFRHPRAAFLGVGGAALLLLFIGIHNAWDNVSYLVLVHAPKWKSAQNPADRP